MPDGAEAAATRAASAAVSYGLNNSGQVCISVERIYVEDAVHDEFLERLAAKTEALRQGPPGEPGTVDVGAIIFPPQLELIEAHVRDAVAKGARVVTGGERGDGPGRFYRPTVLAEVDHSMRCMVEETFGPTLPVMRVRDAEQAIELANDGPYGLQASVWTRDHERGERIARRVEAGTAMVNDAQLNYAALELPMGGWKASGLGSRHGPDGIRKYAKRQSLMITPGHAPSRDAHHFPYSAEVSATIGETFALLATSDLFDDAQRMTLAALCDTFIPALEAPEGEGTGTGSGGARPRTRRSRRGSRWRCFKPSCPRSRSMVCGRCSTRWRRTGSRPAPPNRHASGSCTPSATSRAVAPAGPGSRSRPSSGCAPCRGRAARRRAPWRPP
jgi:Aldehyde dehydrogenase family